MRSLSIIIPGVIIVIFGIIFNFQGQGMVGPETSFMYQNQDWIDNGIIIKGNRLILSGDSNDLLNGKKGEYNAVKTMYFSTQNEIINGEYIHLYPKDNIINNIVIFVT